MPIEDLRARQRQAVIHSKAGMIALEIFRKTEMKPENIQRLQAAHGKYWHQSAAGLPDGWAEIVGQFLASVEDITDLANAVSLRFERCPDGLRAFAFPEISRWHLRTRYSDLFDPANSEEDWRYLISIGPGWWPLLSEFCERLEEGLRHHSETGRWYIRQTKEKMGELRIYVRPAERVDNIDPPEPSAAQEMISIIREQIVGQANHTCEVCGEPGGLRVLDGWYKTCCDQHFLEWQERMASK